MARDMHKDIEGTTDAGRRYHALTPDRTPGRTPRSWPPSTGLPSTSVNLQPVVSLEVTGSWPLPCKRAAANLSREPLT